MKHTKTTAPTTLSGCHVVITHTLGCTRLQENIQTLEGSCTPLPLLDIIHKPLSQFQFQVCREADIWVFLSRHSATDDVSRLREIHEDQHVIAIGPATARALETHNLHVDHMPDLDHSSQGIAEMPIFREHRHKVVVFSEASAASPLVKMLKQQGHLTKHISTYQHMPVASKLWHQAWGQISETTDAITTHSLKGLCQLIACHQQYPLDGLHEKQLIVTTPTMQKTALKNGFQRVHLSPSNAPGDICNALALNRPRRM